MIAQDSDGDGWGPWVTRSDGFRERQRVVPLSEWKPESPPNPLNEGYWGPKVQQPNGSVKRSWVFTHPDHPSNRTQTGGINEETEIRLPDVGRNDRMPDGDSGNLDSMESSQNQRGARSPQGLGNPDSVRISETPKTAPLKTKAKGKARGKTTSTKEESGWLKSQFPRKLPGTSGSWAVTNSGAGFTVDFRIDKRQNNGEPINFGFPRISREMFLTLKGMKANECRKTIEDYVRCHLGDAVRRGDDRARLIAGRLSFAS